MKEIRNVLVIMPVHNEPLDMIMQRTAEMSIVAGQLFKRGIRLEFSWCDDCAPELPGWFSRIVVHATNRGLATTLIGAYTLAVAGVRVERRPDVVIRLDAQEHNALMIPEIVEHLCQSDDHAIFVPIAYAEEGNPRCSAFEIMYRINQLCGALMPMDAKIIRMIYNQYLSVGFQAFRIEFLEVLLPRLQLVMELFRQSECQQDMTWGLDMVAMICAAHLGKIDMLFGGYMSPWAANRLEEHTGKQRLQIGLLLDLLKEKAEVLHLNIAAQ